MNKLFLKFIFVLFPLTLFSQPIENVAPVKAGPKVKQVAPTTSAKGCTPSGIAPPTVGPGYSDPKLCCEGNIIIIQKVACEKPFGGFAGLCAPCGNKKCDTEWEDACNCPEDCGLMAPPPSSSSSSLPVKK